MTARHHTMLVSKFQRVIVHCDDTGVYAIIERRRDPDQAWDYYDMAYASKTPFAIEFAKAILAVTEEKTR